MTVVMTVKNGSMSMKMTMIKKMMKSGSTLMMYHHLRHVLKEKMLSCLESNAFTTKIFRVESSFILIFISKIRRGGRDQF